MCALVMANKCKHFLKSFVEQICSDRSIKAAADYASFSTLSLLSGSMRGSLKSGSMRKEKTFLCIVRRTVGHSYYAHQPPAITFDFAATMSFLKSFLLCSPAITFRLQQQCHFWNWEHSKFHFRLGCSDIFHVLVKQTTSATIFSESIRFGRKF